MKFLILSFLVLSTQFAFAEEDQFAAKKNQVLENIAKRKAHLSEHESCVNSASDKDTLKSCMQNQKEKMKAFKDSRKKNRG